MGYDPDRGTPFDNEVGRSILASFLWQQGAPRKAVEPHEARTANTAAPQAATPLLPRDDRIDDAVARRGDDASPASRPDSPPGQPPPTAASAVEHPSPAHAPSAGARPASAPALSHHIE